MKVVPRKTRAQDLETARKVFLASQSGELNLYTDVQRVQAMETLLSAGKLETYAPLLPLIFNHNGKPYHLADHFPFEPLFSKYVPPNTVIKSGRQVSKCCRMFECHTMSAANGRPLVPEEVIVGTRMLSLDTNFKSVVNKVVERHENPVARSVRVTTRMGSVFSVTPTHDLRDLNGWRSVEELGVGGRVACLLRGGEFTSTATQTHAEIVSAAYLLGDGCCRTPGFAHVSLTTACKKVSDEYIEAIVSIEGKAPARQQKLGSIAWSLSSSGSGVLAKRLQAWGMYGKYSYEKRVPAWVFDLSREDTVLFLSRLWATDGMIKNDKTKPQISYCTTSKLLSRDVRALLTKFGIPCSISVRKTGYKKNGVFKQCRDAYILRVETRRGWQLFLDTFQVPGKPAIQLRDTAQNNNRDTVPIEVNDWISELAKTTAWKHTDSLLASGLRLKPKYALSRRKLDEYIDYFDRVNPTHPRLAQLKAVRDGDVIWDEIVSIEELPEEKSWDVEVEREHNYVLDSIVSHNSTSQASRGLLLSVIIPYFTTLYVAPLYEQIRRFSTQYVRKFLDESPLKGFWMGSSTENSVLQRSFKNFSKMFFSFATLNADRIRGISSNACCFDEVQDLDPNHLPIIRETMSHSPFGAGISIYTGTPKTLDNALEYEWQRSSQAEWAIPCSACKYISIPSLDQDLLKMIGPYHDNIGPLIATDDHPNAGVPATVCAACGHWIDARTGRWVHRYPERRWEYPGLHVPQIIMPIHSEDPKRWRKLVAKQNGADNYTSARFMNEVLGESYDVGSKLVTKTDLERAACLPWKNKPNDPMEQVGRRHNYVRRVMGVDWGGGGEEEVSFTTCAILGLTGSGQIDVIYGKRLLTPNDPIAEARELVQLYNLFECQTLAHDYNGAGNLREVFMLQAGLDSTRVMPFVYTRTANRDIITPHRPGEGNNSKAYWLLDKARALQYVCELIKLSQIKFFQYDYHDVDNRGLLHDFLSLVESKTETQRAGEVYNIIRIAAFPDDFAHSVTFGSCALWHQTGVWPNVAHISNLTLSAAQLEAMNPPNAWSGPEDYDTFAGRF